MRTLARRTVKDPAELATVVAECLPHLEPGLRLLERAVSAGEVTVDVTCVDASGRLVLILCAVVAGPESVLRAVEAAAWWREHTALLGRMFPEAALDPHAAPRALIVAPRVSDRALRLLRALGPVAPGAVECRLFQDADDTVVAFDRLEVAGASGGAAGVSADQAPPRGPEAQRAAVLIERLERLRFSEVFR